MSSKKLRACISGVHGYVPDYILTNSELETLVDTSDEWIMTRTGIKERRILKGEMQGTSVLGLEYVTGLLEKTNHIKLTETHSRFLQPLVAAAAAVVETFWMDGQMAKF